MSPAPLRPEPGPRDWTPTEGYTGGPSSATRPSAATARGPRSPRRPVMPYGDYTLGAFVFGLIALVIAAVYVPDGAHGGTVLVSSIGMLALLLAASTTRAWRAGASRRRRAAQVGGIMGAAALASSAIVLVNGWFGLNVPSIPDATRVTVTAVSELVASVTHTRAGVGDAGSLGQPIVVAEPADAAKVPVGAPDPAVYAPEPFATADAEFLQLARELGTVVYLITQVSPDGAPDALFASPTGYSYVDRPHSVMVTHGDWLSTGYARGVDGSYTITMTGTQFGSIAYYHSAAGVIERR